MYDNSKIKRKFWTTVCKSIGALVFVFIGLYGLHLVYMGINEGLDELIFRGLFILAVEYLVFAGFRMVMATDIELDAACTAECVEEMAKSMEKLSSQMEELMKKIDTVPTPDSDNEVVN